MTLTEEAIEKIKTMILTGELLPGERLPKEDELASRLGLSRGSLREAVRALSLVRILDVRHGDGTYVTSLKPELLFEVVTFVAEFQQDESALDFLQVRRFIEPPATGLAAHRMDSETIAELDVLVRSANMDATDEAFLDLDRQFHRNIVASIGNPVLLSLLDSIAGPTRRARIWRAVIDTNARDRTISEHRGIIDAIRLRQSDVAEARAIAHIAGIEDAVRQAMLIDGRSDVQVSEY